MRISVKFYNIAMHPELSTAKPFGAVEYESGALIPQIGDIVELRGSDLEEVSYVVDQRRVLIHSPDNNESIDTQTAHLFLRELAGASKSER